jgi:pyoverdine/dityrosine biosynthesis protein Dit1/AcrR family transcriptional regulator
MVGLDDEQPRARRSRLRILEAALDLFATEGYERATLQRVAKAAGTSVGLACRYFPAKEQFVLALYDRLARQLEEWSVDMPQGTVADRFRAAVEKKLELVASHRATLLAVAGKALDPAARANVLGPATEVVRSKVAGVFWLAVVGATDAPPGADAARLARMLYGVHLLLILIALQGDAKATQGAIDLAHLALASGGVAAVGALFGDRVDAVFGSTLSTSRALATEGAARLVLDRIFRRRRTLPGASREPSESARTLHLGRIEALMASRERIQLVLPAFPAKAPNAEKVLGKLPDAAESLALESLAELLEEIREAYPPGGELVICSDGHVFADVVGVSDADVRAYRRALEAMIDELATEHIKFFGLEDAFGEVSASKARELLLASYGDTEAAVRARAKGSPIHAAQVDGIHRLLFEDEVVRAPKQSRTQSRNVTRARAYEVVRRSDAWGNLVATAFPQAVRLSIHPQPDVSPKIGIALLATTDAWLTPWHGVALFEGDRARLVHRRDAERLGAVVVEEDGRPCAMEIT